MQYFTLADFIEKYEEYANISVPNWQIEAVCEMIFSQIGLRYRDANWDTESVPISIKMPLWNS